MGSNNKIISLMRIVAILEGLSYLFLFFVSMPLKYMADMPLPNKIGGMFHGILFIAYILLIFPTAKVLNWGGKTKALAALASILPFGTFYIDKKYLQQ
ncbi:MAG: DUF3817 domain-containing protein [Chitinophagales bacterium]|nr:DUF3817 domain-containing protein [Chitinophagales bacterium]